ncbi:hypothetical protein NDA13_003813 [Ustilago tritici]|nr:hypothetical protein NDA13_003813 [Ustilago tritici]
MSHVEDWSEGDFDLEHIELRTDHVTLQHVDILASTSAHVQLDGQPNWGDDFPEDTLDDGSDEHTDTIKLSTAASSALKRMLDASKASTSSTQHTTQDDDLDAQLRPPALDLARISQHTNTNQLSADYLEHEDMNACSSASLSTSASTSYRSMMGLSTDLTDPDSPRSKNSARHTSSLSSHSSDRARSDREIHSSGPEESLEMDFELAPDMNNLSLCSSLSRARSNTSLSHVSRDTWDDDLGASAPPSSTTHTSASSLHPPSLSSHRPASIKSLSGESDADDEHEDLLEGLDLEGSIFQAHLEHSIQTAPVVKAELEAMLDLKRSGNQTESSENQSQSADSDAGIAAGLVITDDFDLSSSRIAARGLPARPYQPPNARNAAHGLGVESITAQRPYVQFSHDDGDRGHPTRTASQHSSSTPSLGAVSSQAPATRSEFRGAHRNRLRFKRSASDLQAHLSKTAPDIASAAPSRPTNRGSQLTRKRSLPSMRTSPPAASSSSAALVSSAIPSSLTVRQRHNSGNAGASSASHFRGKGTSRLTDSTAASRARAAETAADHQARFNKNAGALARPSTPISFPARPVHRSASRISINTRSKTRPDQERRGSSGESQPVARLLKRSAPYGSGAELDGIEDLPNASSPIVQSARPQTSSSTPTTAESSAAASQRANKPKRGGRCGAKSKPALIRSLGAGASPAHKSVKGMRWNAQALRWEGNKGVLRDFDQVIQSSTRPALISQLTGSSTSSALTHAAGYSSPLSPESSTLMSHIASGARVVGDMLFDPVQMRWVKKSGDEEDDVFADFDDRTEDVDAAHKPSNPKIDVEDDNTLRARRTRSTETFSRFSNPWTQMSEKHDSGSPVPDEDAPERSATRKNDQAIRRALSRYAFASSVGIDRELWDACIQAEKRHAIEIDGCFPATGSRLRTRTQSSTSSRSMTMDEIDRPRPHLYYLEKIAKSIVKENRP